MAGSIITFIGMFVLAELELQLIRFWKAKYPEIIQKHRIWFAILCLLMAALGIFASFLIGGVVNGAKINSSVILLLVKFVVVLTISSLLLLIAANDLKAVLRAHKAHEVDSRHLIDLVACCVFGFLFIIAVLFFI